MKDRLQYFVLSLCLLLYLLSGCSQISNTEPVHGSHSDTPAPAIYSESVTGPSQEVWSEQPTAQPDPIDPTATPAADSKADGTAMPKVPIGSDEYTSKAKGDGIPAYAGSAYAVLNSNQPYFQQHELSTAELESYSGLDALGRCGAAFANVSPQSMPTEERGSIGQVKPSGWHTVRYDCVDGQYLYNRCHLIGYQLAAENANVKNLITGTRYLNMEGMLPFENMVADYVEETGNHVAYRVTPVFHSDDLLASGVLMEGYSIEDQGEGICFCIFAYNVQPGVTIDYRTGESRLSEDREPGDVNTVDVPLAATPAPAISMPPTATLSPAIVEPPSAGPTQPEQEEDVPALTVTYIVNTNTGKFHYPSCSSVRQMNEENKWRFSGTADELLQKGYVPCQRCRP